MMKQITLLVLLVTASINAQIQLDMEYYVVEYSEEYQGPTHVEYKVLCPGPGVSRKGLNFHTEPGVETADNDDYYKNVWDKGHMAPAASFNCTYEMLYTTFSYVNSALQHQSLNRGPWKATETRERVLAASGDTYVIIDILYNDTNNKVPGGATIPTDFIKTIYVDGIQMEEYKYKNMAQN